MSSQPVDRFHSPRMKHAGGSLLPHLAPFPRPAHHRRIFLATKRLRKRGQIRQRPDHPILRNRVRISLHHLSLRLRTNFVPPPLPPRNEKLLARRKSVQRRSQQFFIAWGQWRGDEI